MPIAARHRTDPVPPLTPLPDLVVRQETDAGAMAVLQKRMPEEMAQRFEQARDPMHAGTITNGALGTA